MIIPILQVGKRQLVPRKIGSEGQRGGILQDAKDIHNKLQFMTQVAIYISNVRH